MIHIPACTLLLSLMTSIILCVIRKRGVASFLYITMSVFSCISSFVLIRYVKKFGSYTYSFGNWTDGTGIDMSANPLSALLLLILSSVFFLTSYGILRSKHIKTSTIGFCALVFTGLYGLIVTTDWFNFYVFLELTSISLYVVLTSDYGDGKSYFSAFSYLIMGSVANIFILLGIFFIYHSTGTLNMEKVSNIIALKIGGGHRVLISAAYVFIITGLLAKSAVYPLHSWIMRSYINIPSSLTAFIAAIVTKIMIFNIYKVNLFFGNKFLAENLQYFISCATVLSFLSIVVCSLGALLESNIKRIIAFSSMAQSGYMIMGIMSFNNSVIGGVFMQMIAHSLAVIVLFMVIDIIELRYHYRMDINTVNLQFLLKKQKIIRFAFVVSLFSVIGFPMTIGFIAKWYMLNGFYASGSYISFAVIIIGTGMGMLYSWRLVEYLFFQSNDEDRLFVEPGKIAMVAKVIILCISALLISMSIFNNKISYIIYLALK